MRAELCRINAPPKVEGVQVVGKAVDGNIIRGVGRYLGGNQGPSLFEWFRLNTNSKVRVLLSNSCNEYILTKEDVGRCLVFRYTLENTYTFLIRVFLKMLCEKTFKIFRFCESTMLT